MDRGHLQPPLWLLCNKYHEEAPKVNKQIISRALFLGLTCLMLTTCFGCGEAGCDHDQVRAVEIDPAVIAALDADYYIDYAGGTIPLGDLPIGARVVDPSWEWEFRAGNNYSGSGAVKPVTWLVVAKDHYSGFDPHVTLLAEELIGLFPFDNSTDSDHEYAEYGYGHWGESGTGNADRGLRPWLNSTGLHAGEGFCRAFSESFKRAVLTTTVPNKEWQNGSAYTTSDNVFIPSTTEFGDEVHNLTYPIGKTYVYFQGAGDEKRVALLGGDARLYWTRSPGSFYGDHVCFVEFAGGFSGGSAYGAYRAVRPALNLKSEILVSEIKPSNEQKEGIEVPRSSFKSRLGVYPNYKINIPNEIVAQIDEIVGTEKHPVYKRKKVDISPMVAKFEAKFASAGPVVSDFPFKDELSFVFENPVEVANIDFDNIESVEEFIKNLNTEIFSEEFDYKVKEIVKDGDGYRIDMARILNGNEVFMYNSSPYLYFTPEGKLKAGSFHLTKFEEAGEVHLLSGEKLRQFVNAPRWRKNVGFTFKNPEDYEDFDIKGEMRGFLLALSNEQEGRIDFTGVEPKIVYYFAGDGYEYVLPALLLDNGSGVTNMKGKDYEANFQVLANMLTIDYEIK